MQYLLHRNTDRGEGEYGWLRSRYSFSFAQWYNPFRMGFGALRVLNDDAVAPFSGFDTHPHRDMEIITIVTEGAVTHRDSMGHSGVVRAGDVQVMSAGSGVHHSEHNESTVEMLRLFQLWIEPYAAGLSPRYDQKSCIGGKPNEWLLLVSGSGKEGALKINQNAYISWGEFRGAAEVVYDLHTKRNGLYLFVVEGDLNFEEVVLGPRDAVGIRDTLHLSAEAATSATLLAIEVPMEE